MMSILYNCYQWTKFLPSREVVGTNNLVIGLKKGYKENKLCIVSVLDNLVKGAAGQAVQNFNLMNDYDERLGL